jgi:bacteriorhodopsin
MFSALCLYLVGSNSTRVSYIQKASLEKRLSVCCQINTIVASLSAFLNFFQLTEVDNFALGGQRSMTVDVSRPIEWILTCPLMQLNLVLMGGSRIPEYRRTLMPGLSATVLFLGAFTLFVDKPYIFVIWAVACCFHGSQVFFNVLQIKEHSAGVESLLNGDSEFRKATMILMGTWLPFPLWYILSPEGFGVVTNITIIQLGWAFLNVTAKFSLIFYMQRVKDNYCNRLKVKREMKGALNNAYSTEGDEDDSCDGGKVIC